MSSGYRRARCTIAAAAEDGAETPRPDGAEGVVEHLVHSLGSAITPWGYVALFAVTLLEAAAFVGLVIPGEAALLVAGALAQQGRLSLWICIVVAVIGGVIGDSIGYEIGRHVGPRLRSSRLGRKVGEKRWDRAQDYVRDHGGRAVFLGRWVGLLRALVPAVVGDARMPYRTFLGWNVAGAATHLPAVIIAGYVAGRSYKVVERYLGTATFAVLGVVVVGAVGLHLWRRHQSDDDEPTSEEAEPSAR